MPTAARISANPAKTARRKTGYRRRNIDGACESTSVSERTGSTTASGAADWIARRTSAWTSARLDRSTRAKGLEGNCASDRYRIAGGASSSAPKVWSPTTPMMVKTGASGA